MMTKMSGSFFQDFLKDAGYRPIDARDGKEGLERTKDEPALIILDLRDA